MVSPIIGVRTLQQFEDNIAALAVELSTEQVATLDAASRVEMGFPHDMLDSPMSGMMFGGITVEKRRN